MSYDDLQKNTFDLHQRILIVNRGFLLDEAVVCLISSRKNLDVSTINFECEDVLVNDIISRHPEVVVMGQSENVKIEQLYRSLTTNPTLGKLRMISIHSNDNMVDIFSCEGLQLIPSDDFLALVRGTQAI